MKTHPFNVSDKVVLKWDLPPEARALYDRPPVRGKIYVVREVVQPNSPGSVKGGLKLVGINSRFVHGTRWLFRPSWWHKLPEASATIIHRRKRKVPLPATPPAGASGHSPKGE